MPPIEPTQHAPRDNRTGADDRLVLALIEVDRFGALRRTIGYAAAGRLLASLSADIEQRFAGARSVRSDRTLIEITFAAASKAAASAALTGLASSLTGRIEIEGYGFDLSLTIGFVDMGVDAISDEYLGAAERALTIARQSSPRIAHADAVPGNEPIDRLTLMRALQNAIRNDGLSLHYQPKVSARSGVVGAVEALVRWDSPQLGVVTPDMFVPIAEETGDIRAMTEWVLDRAIKDQHRLARNGIVPRIDINISGGSLGDAAFTSALIERVADAPGAIGFEITETSMIADPAQALANLRLCAAAGISLAIDDYGSGFSSLAYLQQLPVEELKIDRSFISRLATHQRDPLLVRSTIDLAHALEMHVTAEGIESAHVLALLQVMGCDTLQGYHLARPMPLDALATYLAGGAAHASVQPHPSRLFGRGGMTAAAP